MKHIFQKPARVFSIVYLMFIFQTTIQYDNFPLQLTNIGNSGNELGYIETCSHGSIYLRQNLSFVLCYCREIFVRYNFVLNYLLSTGQFLNKGFCTSCAIYKQMKLVNNNLLVAALNISSHYFNRYLAYYSFKDILMKRVSLFYLVTVILNLVLRSCYFARSIYFLSHQIIEVSLQGSQSIQCKISWFSCFFFLHIRFSFMQLNTGFELQVGSDLQSVKGQHSKLYSFYLWEFFIPLPLRQEEQ